MTVFAEMSALMNSAVVDLLADAEADFGWTVVPGIFRHEYGESFGMVGGSKPVFECLSASVVGIGQDAPLTIAGEAFVVAEIAEDGRGMVRFVLEAV